MAKKGSGNWKPFVEPGPGVLVGDPLMSGQRPDEGGLDKRVREKVKIPAVTATSPSPETIGGGSDKPNVKTPKSDK